MDHPGRLQRGIREGIYGLIILLTSSSPSFGAYMTCTYEQAEEAIRIGRTLDTPQKAIAFYKKEWGFVLGEVQGEVRTPFARLVTDGSPISRDPSFQYDKAYIAESLKSKVSINKEILISLERKIANAEQKKKPRQNDLNVEFKGKIYPSHWVLLTQALAPFVAHDDYYFKIPGLKGDSKIKLILNDSITGIRYETVVDLSKMR